MNRKYICNSNDYMKIPGCPIAYWGEILFDAFDKYEKMNDLSIARAGLSTGDNNLYMKLWHEVAEIKIGWGLLNNMDFIKSKKKYVPCNKGGEFRRWYGNNEYVVDWFNSKSFHRPRTTYLDLYYKPALTWTVLTTGKFCVRYYGEGFLFDHAAASLFPREIRDYYYMLGYLNTRVANYLIDMINPTLNTGADVVLKLPISPKSECYRDIITEYAKTNTALCITDWDSFETSWDFKKHPLI